MDRASYHHGDLKQALLVAAEAELKDNGLEGFTLRGVAKRAGVSHAAPAHHFKDTAAILTALATICSERLHDTMVQCQAASPKDPRSQYIACGVGYVEFALANPALFKLMFGSQRPELADPQLSRSAHKSFQLLVDGVTALSGEQPMTTEAGILRVAASWSMVHGIASLLIAQRMAFLSPMLARDRRKTLTDVIAKLLPT